MQGFIITLLICSVTMSALALFYMAVMPLLAKRYSATGCYYAWLIFVIGLMIPFRPQFSNAIFRIQIPGKSAVSMIPIQDVAPTTAHVPVPNAIPPAMLNLSWWQIAAAVWLAGMIIFLAYYFVKHCRFLKLAVRWSENITEGQTLALLQTLKAQMGISKNISLRVCDSIGSPMMIGFVNPHILLPKVTFANDELRFILKHELVHDKRKDLWYKCLVLIATAIHWFNPMIHLMAKAIAVQCELSCDAEVVRSMGADTRQYYSETIINVVRFQSKYKTALSTHFYGGKKGMKSRIFSIMDMGKKKAGAVVFCGALILTLGTGVVFAANAQTHTPQMINDHPNAVTPWVSVRFMPSPDTYAPYAAFGITISADGTKLLYKGELVRLFTDEKTDTETFYLDESGHLNLSVVRNVAGEITGIEELTAQKAQEYYANFFAEELDSPSPKKVSGDIAMDLAEDIVKEEIQEGGNKYANYQPLGITYSATDEALYFNGQRVKFFIDHPAGEGVEALWADDAGTVNVAALRNSSGQITGIERLSDEKAREYRSAAERYVRIDLDELEEKIKAKTEK